MPRGESNYAHVEVDFFADGRLQKWPNRAKLGYLSWWFTALQERREVLLPFQTRCSLIAHRTGIGTKAVQDGLKFGQNCEGKPLLIVYESGHVRVCGVRRKHANLKNWHDQEDVELMGRLAPIQPQFSPQTRATSRAEPCRAETTPPPQTPPKATAVLVDPLEESNPDNPYRKWQEVSPILRQADISMITAMHEQFRDIDICEAMQIAMDKGKSLAYVRGILAKRKQEANGSTSPSASLTGWTPEQIAAAKAASGKTVKT